MPDQSKRANGLRAVIRLMDDGMGIVKDIYDESALGRYAHVADGSHGRNVYTDDSPEPDAAYSTWKRLLTWDLDADVEVWPASPVDLAVEHG